MLRSIGCMPFNNNVKSHITAIMSRATSVDSGVFYSFTGPKTATKVDFISCNLTLKWQTYPLVGKLYLGSAAARETEDVH